jgi:hypothetical protein
MLLLAPGDMQPQLARLPIGCRETVNAGRCVSGRLRSRRWCTGQGGLLLLQSQPSSQPGPQLLAIIKADLVSEFSR